MTTVSLRIDDKTKRELDAMCEEMGMIISKRKIASTFSK